MFIDSRCVCDTNSRAMIACVLVPKRLYYEAKLSVVIVLHFMSVIIIGPICRGIVIFRKRTKIWLLSLPTLGIFPPA